MKFDMEILKESGRASRDSWNKSHYLTYSEERSEIMEHLNGIVRIWYWVSPEDFARASEDLNAADWRYK